MFKVIFLIINVVYQEYFRTFAAKLRREVVQVIVL